RLDFTLDGCDGVALPSGTGCKLAVHFTPKISSGQRVAALFIDAGEGGVQSVGLAGEAVQAAKLRATVPGDGDFGGVSSGQSSDPAEVTILNAGGLPSSPVTVTLDGADADSFSIASNGCLDKEGHGVALADSHSCALRLQFSPLHKGMHSAILH